MARLAGEQWEARGSEGVRATKGFKTTDGAVASAAKANHENIAKMHHCAW